MDVPTMWVERGSVGCLHCGWGVVMFTTIRHSIMYIKHYILDFQTMDISKVL